MNKDLKKYIAVTAMIIVASVSNSAWAKSDKLEFRAVEEKKLLKGAHQIDAAKGYIYLYANSRQFGVFFKEPSEANIAAYEAKWAKKFAKAKRKYERELKNWRIRKESTGRGGKKPVKPIEKTFSIGPIELWNAVKFGPQFIFSKDKSNKENPLFSYMMEVEPGNYAYHGPILSAPGAAALGVCYCMGSVKFEVKAGEITNLGNFLTNAPDIDNGGSALLGPMLLQKSAPDSKQLRWRKNPVEFVIPDSLVSYKMMQPKFSPSGKMNNFYRAMVSRMAPVDGLFHYDRDRAVDLSVPPEIEPISEQDDSASK